MQLQRIAKTSPESSVTAVQAGKIQWKLRGENEQDEDCPKCRKGLLNLQRSSTNISKPSSVPQVVHEVLNSQGQPLDMETRSFMEPRFGHIFCKVRVHADSNIEKSASIPEAVNSTFDVEEDQIHHPLIERFREKEDLPPGGRDKEGNLIGPSDAQIKYLGFLLPCPISTEVAEVIDLRNKALAAGFRTAYGIHSKMRVLPDFPDGPTWRVEIKEALKLGANNCPDTLTKGDPCSGSSTFTVGAASGNSPVLSGPRPGVRNHFWDFHTTHVRPRDVSVLHDSTRNPANLNTCSTTCNQEYSCGDKVIGRHTITRTFSKGSHNKQDVTFVEVKKV
jgi:hypothetical protein